MLLLSSLLGQMTNKQTPVPQEMGLPLSFSFSVYSTENLLEITIKISFTSSPILLRHLKGGIIKILKFSIRKMTCFLVHMERITSSLKKLHLS